MHHAGMTRQGRALVEVPLAEGSIQMPACSAWGVDLSAHSVIIRGMQIYNSQMVDWVELGHKDVLPMLGRVSCIQLGTFSGGIIIVNRWWLQYHPSLTNRQPSMLRRQARRQPQRRDYICHHT